MATMFENCILVMPDCLLPDGALLMDNGKILWAGARRQAPMCPSETIDCEGLYLSPGFLDLHTHGGGGGSFLSTSKEEFITALRMHMEHGTTTLLPTVIVREAAHMKELVSIHQQLREEMHLPHFPGFFLEGPYVSANPAVQGFRKSGGSDPVILPEVYRPILQAGEGLILRWMAAPELSGALAFASELRATGILPCMGHCAPVYKQVLEAMEAGYDCAVHLYSAMSTITREQGFRRAGLIETALLLDSLTAEIVADGCHVPPELLKLAIKCKGYDKLMLVSDSCPFAGLENGQHFTMLGCLVMIEDGVCKLEDRSAFAGGVLCGDGLVRTVVTKCEVPIWAAVRMITKTPAHYMGWDGVKGELCPGADADLVLFDRDINIQKVWVSGRKEKG